MTSSSIPAVRGFRFAGVSAGIKNSGAADLGLAVTEKPATTAAVFTQNLVVAAPVKVARERVQRGRCQAVLVNSGNANACTGKPGLEAVMTTTRALADALELEPGQVVPASTGVIGQVLPSEKVLAALPSLVNALDEHGADAFSLAILTTDQGPKVAVRTVRIGKHAVTLLGIAKGAGMIDPNMATTLGFVFTDAKLSSTLLSRALAGATDRSFNVATVDGETSTNDMLLAMASGAADIPQLKAGDRGYKLFQAALEGVLRELAELIVADGEGSNHVAEIEVRGTKTDADARKVAQRVATSLLVKTAMHGKDPNWGRILSAAGMASVKFDPHKVSISFDKVLVVEDGVGVGPEAEDRARAVMAGARYAIRLKLGRGKGRGAYLTCDIGHRYIDVNASYRS